MKPSREVERAISRCIRHKIPFAFVIMPDDGEGAFFASSEATEYNGDSGADGFMIREFVYNPESAPLIIRKDLSVSDINAIKDADIDLPDADVTPETVNTAFSDYSIQCQTLIDTIKRQGGKTVLSRLIAVESSKSAVEVAFSYFAIFPDTMRFIYFTKQTGLWFGASPELLIDYDSCNKVLNTMSLAGTRKAQTTEFEWDEKNVEEHRFVTEHITDVLKDNGLRVEIYDSAPLRFGKIEHLCDRIRAYGDVDPVRLLDVMSPTPALCGVPCKEAYEQIIKTEKHCRRCYGGWIGMAKNRHFTAYVNLRCAFAKPEGDKTWYNIYVGGGLTAQSVVEQEWIETERKAEALRSVISE